MFHSDDIDDFVCQQIIGDLYFKFASHFAHIKSYVLTFNIFSSLSETDWEEVPLQLRGKLIDLEFSEDLKSEFAIFSIS